MPEHSLKGLESKILYVFRNNQAASMPSIEFVLVPLICYQGYTTKTALKSILGDDRQIYAYVGTASGISETPVLVLTAMRGEHQK